MIVLYHKPGLLHGSRLLLPHVADSINSTGAPNSTVDKHLYYDDTRNPAVELSAGGY